MNVVASVGMDHMSSGGILMTGLDLEIIAQIFVGGKGAIFEGAGSAWYAALQYSF